MRTTSSHQAQLKGMFRSLLPLEVSVSAENRRVRRLFEAQWHRSGASTVFDGSAAEARERHLKAAESRSEKAAARGISDMERVKDFAEGSSEVFAYGARHRLRAELDRAAAKSAAEKKRKEKK